MLPYREPAPNHPLRSSGVTPAPCPISEPPTLSGSPSSPPPPYPKPPLQPPVHNPLSLPSLPPIWWPMDRGVELGAPPGDNNASAVPKWCKITMLFNGGRKTWWWGKKKQWTRSTLKAQSVHQRWRKVCLTNNRVRKLFLQK